VKEPALRFVTRADGTIGALAQELGFSDALADGRVFVAARRLLDAAANVAAGSAIDVHAPRVADGDARVLATHGELVFADKPPGMATEPDHAGIDGSLLARVSALAGVPREALSAPSRLDVGVSGVVTLASGSAGREAIEALRRAGRFQKRYVAIACASPQPPRGTWSFPIGRGAGSRRRAGGPDAKAAETRYVTIARTPDVRLLGGRGSERTASPALLALEPVTGRTHQLRVHASAGGASLFGDPSYAGAERAVTADGSVISAPRVALHSLSVELELEAGRLRVVSPPPRDLVETWVKLGGTESAFEEALTAAW
jgi:tRNA pseudouridine32 synthase/23S rRNA pseudouridine746 synthase